MNIDELLTKPETLNLIQLLNLVPKDNALLTQEKYDELEMTLRSLASDVTMPTYEEYKKTPQTVVQEVIIPAIVERVDEAQREPLKQLLSSGKGVSKVKFISDLCKIMGFSKYGPLIATLLKTRGIV
jgi:hypothetical protein